MIGLGLALTAIGSIYTGVTSLTAANRTAKDLEYQGQIALDEAFRDASIIREEGRNFAATQSLQYIGAGVELVGSALITMEQTRKYAESEAMATEQRGGAQANLANRKASVTRSQGRAALIGSIFDAGAAVAPGIAGTKATPKSTVTDSGFPQSWNDVWQT